MNNGNEDAAHPGFFENLSEILVIWRYGVTGSEGFRFLVALLESGTGGYMHIWDETKKISTRRWFPISALVMTVGITLALAVGAFCFFALIIFAACSLLPSSAPKKSCIGKLYRKRKAARVAQNLEYQKRTESGQYAI